MSTIITAVIVVKSPADVVVHEIAEHHRETIGPVGVAFGGVTAYLSTAAAATLVEQLLPFIPTIDIDNSPTGEVPPDIITTSDGTRYPVDSTSGCV